jgi:hypothetical protein
MDGRQKTVEFSDHFQRSDLCYEMSKSLNRISQSSVIKRVKVFKSPDKKWALPQSEQLRLMKLLQRETGKSADLLFTSSSTSLQIEFYILIFSHYLKTL